ncbi:(deoxy)nucleoside triphosphate pyrophosphohydrolase [Flexivirga sp. ID2601S]|uniref:8-oxo-dGTP diphosphatase n=1 Tax=Flexivirga aerilata TaxID=1656889 RepID=A0A849AFC0_9MICO|nr:(deoxy)nucleoside triphosphate pyrophosphohydrolase [Flexivirga aerilata]
MTRRAVVGAAIVDDLRRPTRLLAAQRAEPSSLAGGWELPGGKVEPGEGPIDALHREVQEELDVRVRLGDQVPGPLTAAGAAWPLGASYAMQVWWAEIIDGTPEFGPEHQAIRWLTPDELYDVAWLTDDLPIVQRLEAAFRCTG